MNLISCDKCGVVLDKDKLCFPDDLWKEDGSIDERFGGYNQNTGLWAAYVSCPVCDSEIFE